MGWGGEGANQGNVIWTSTSPAVAHCLGEIFAEMTCKYDKLDRTAPAIGDAFMQTQVTAVGVTENDVFLPLSIYLSHPRTHPPSHPRTHHHPRHTHPNNLTPQYGEDKNLVPCSLCAGSETTRGYFGITLKVMGLLWLAAHPPRPLPHPHHHHPRPTHTPTMLLHSMMKTKM